MIEFEVNSPKEGGKKVKAFQCYPEGKTSVPGVVVLHGMEGFQAHHAEFGKNLAKEGYAVLAPLWFERDTKGKTVKDVEVKDITSGIDYLQSINCVASDRIGVIGFSLGALVSLIVLSCSGQNAEAQILFYPPPGKEKIDQFFPNIEISSNFTEKITQPTLIIQGDEDRFISVGETRGLCSRLKKNNPDCELKLYPGVDHAFNWSDREEYDSKFAQKAWGDLLDFLAKYL